MPLSPLPASFYNRAAQEVARDLLGARLVRTDAGARTGGYIIETEAYDGESDLACHARAGQTPRTRVMYGPPGRAYVYFIYGMHWMLNCVTGPEGSPAAVLIRGLLPSEGLEEIARRRQPVRQSDWANGPARLCLALGIDQEFNGSDLTNPSGLLNIEPGIQFANEDVLTGPRIGIDRVAEPWRSIPWRFHIKAPSPQAFPD